MSHSPGFVSLIDFAIGLDAYASPPAMAVFRQIDTPSTFRGISALIVSKGARRLGIPVSAARDQILDRLRSLAQN